VDVIKYEKPELVRMGVIVSSYFTDSLIEVRVCGNNFPVPNTRILVAFALGPHLHHFQYCVVEYRKIGILQAVVGKVNGGCPLVLDNSPITDAVDFMRPGASFFRGIFEPLVEVAHKSALHNFMEWDFWNKLSEGFGTGTTLQVFLENAVYDFDAFLSEGVKYVGGYLFLGVGKTGGFHHTI
jgi:hypothetical protein